MMQLARLVESTDQLGAVGPSECLGEGPWGDRLSESGLRSGRGLEGTMPHRTGALPFHSGEIARGAGEDIAGLVPAGKATTTSRWV